MSAEIAPCSPIGPDQIGEWFEYTDVLIVGFGGAVACAALEAHACGAKVTVLEVSSGSGSTTSLSGGNAMEKRRSFPAEIPVGEEVVLLTLKPLANSLNIRIKTDNLSAIMEFKKAMADNFRKRRF